MYVDIAQTCQIYFIVSNTYTCCDILEVFDVFFFLIVYFNIAYFEYSILHYKP